MERVLVCVKDAIVHLMGNTLFASLLGSALILVPVVGISLVHRGTHKM